MKFVRILAIALLALSVSACACRTKKVGPEDNIPLADAGGPLKDINFAFDRYDLDATARGILNSNAQWLKGNPGAKVQIEGHCDERGTNEYNMALGWKRANAGADYLKAAGIESGRIGTISYGESVPLDPAHNETAWARNRRDHFKVEGR